MRRVILESPYAGDVEVNVEYARKCVRDSLSPGEAPIASHLLYTQSGILRDEVPDERQWGIDAGLAWRAVADKTVVYTDRGISKGMEYGIRAAERAGIPIEYRSIVALQNQPDRNHAVAGFQTQGVGVLKDEMRASDGFSKPGQDVAVG